eukprot:9502826-Alexandrium_andersonii.AAC.1
MEYFRGPNLIVAPSACERSRLRYLPNAAPAGLCLMCRRSTCHCINTGKSACVLLYYGHPQVLDAN